MKLPPGVIEDGVLRIDWSGFGKIQHCWREAWHLLAHRREPDYRDEAMGFGSAVHEALDWRQRAMMAGTYEAARTLAEMETIIEAAYQGVELDDDEFRTEGRAKETCALYLKNFPDEPFDVLASEQAMERELGTAIMEVVPAHAGPVELRPIRVIWQGRVDGIWRDRRTMKRTIKDSKTMKECQLEREMAKYKMSGQMKMYCWMADCEDAVIDVIVNRKPLQRVTAASAPRTEFHRLAFHYDQAVIDECRRDILKILSDWLTACAHPTEPPPMNLTSCAWPRVCPYLACCENSQEEDRMRWLMSGNYRLNEWNPMADQTKTKEIS